MVSEVNISIQKPRSITKIRGLPYFVLRFRKDHNSKNLMCYFSLVQIQRVKEISKMPFNKTKALEKPVISISELDVRWLSIAHERQMRLTFLLRKENKSVSTMTLHKFTESGARRKPEGKTTKRPYAGPSPPSQNAQQQKPIAQLKCSSKSP